MMPVFYQLRYPADDEDCQKLLILEPQSQQLPICHIKHLELISEWMNVVGSIFKTTIGGTRIWTQNSKYRMKELKTTIAMKPFFPPGPPKNPPA